MFLFSHFFSSVESRSPKEKRRAPTSNCRPVICLPFMLPLFARESAPTSAAGTSTDVRKRNRCS